MKKAFTLAEVLITLGIIGIVAAMTMPTLLQSYKKQEASARLKKFYSSMQQAIRMSELEHGDSASWTRDGGTQNDQAADGKITKDFFMKYLAPYFKYTSIMDAKNAIMNGEEVLVNGNNTIIYMADGTYVSLYNGTCIDINFDVNGHKLPNEKGKDIFVFLICFDDNSRNRFCVNPKKSFCSFGDNPSIAKNRAQVLDLCKNNKYHNHCSRLLEIDNWEFKEDYPFKL